MHPDMTSKIPNDIELHSVHSDGNDEGAKTDYETGGIGNLQVSKLTREQQDKEFKEAYSNPFKPENILANKEHHERDGSQ